MIEIISIGFGLKTLAVLFFTFIGFHSWLKTKPRLKLKNNHYHPREKFSIVGALRQLDLWVFYRLAGRKAEYDKYHGYIVETKRRLEQIEQLTKRQEASWAECNKSHDNILRTQRTLLREFDRKLGIEFTTDTQKRLEEGHKWGVYTDNEVREGLGIVPYGDDDVVMTFAKVAKAREEERRLNERVYHDMLMTGVFTEAEAKWLLDMDTDKERKNFEKKTTDERRYELKDRAHRWGQAVIDHGGDAALARESFLRLEEELSALPAQAPDYQKQATAKQVQQNFEQLNKTMTSMVRSRAEETEGIAREIREQNKAWWVQADALQRGYAVEQMRQQTYATEQDSNMVVEESPLALPPPGPERVIYR